MKIYFVAKTVDAGPRRVTQGVVDRRHWVTLKKMLAADGFVITYWSSLDDTAEDHAAA